MHSLSIHAPSGQNERRQLASMTQLAAAVAFAAATLAAAGLGTLATSSSVNVAIAT